MIGMNQKGKHLNDLDHLRQSIQIILSTRVGTRVMRRDFGSDLPNLIDKPVNSETVALFVAATAKALHKWEKRFKLSTAKVIEHNATGRLTFDLRGTYKPTGKQITLNGIIVE